MNAISEFKTPKYEGVWFSFDEDRQALRAAIQKFLQNRFPHLSAELKVDERGPHFGSLKGLSYSHTGQVALLCFSETIELGVDVEAQNRVFSTDYRKLAQRFFHPNEAKALLSRESFLTHWIRKEAYAKLSRDGLSTTVSLELSQTPAILTKIPVVPAGYEAWLASF